MQRFHGAAAGGVLRLGHVERRVEVRVDVRARALRGLAQELRVRALTKLFRG